MRTRMSTETVNGDKWHVIYELPDAQDSTDPWIALYDTKNKRLANLFKRRLDSVARVK